ncbi:MAG: acyl-ACP--UDP-N-acetylglucosamine O-acyltransferase [Acidobacteriota bacterium]
MNIHPTAIINPDAKLGNNVRVGAYAIIESDTEIGEDTEIRAHAVIKRFTQLGTGNVIYEGAILGGEPQDLRFTDCESFLKVGDCNRIREGVTMHRASKAGAATVVGSDCFIMAYAHVAHDCQLGSRVIIANNVALAGHITIEDQVFISGGVVIHQFSRIGRLAMLGGNSKIVQDCLPFVITDGVPGRASGLNVVGLRRAGFAASDLHELKRAYRTLLRAGLSLEDALAELAAQDHPLVRHLADFARAAQRGFCHE